MYYHILIEVKGTYEHIVKEDLVDLDSIKASYIKPYLKGEKFRISGRHIDPKDIDRIIIRRSLETMEQFLNNEKRRLLANNIIMVYGKKEALLLGDVGTDITDELIESCEKELKQTETNPIISKEKPKFGNKIFIVHGHDELAISDVKAILKANDLEPIVLREQPNGGQSIIEKLDANTDNVGYAIILYTPCDVGAKNELNDNKEYDIKSRARQNVIFEHGILIGKIGRNRICSLVKEGVETPGDYAGVVYTIMDSYGAWKTQLLKELKHAGYKINFETL